jgi:hypothetical protein
VAERSASAEESNPHLAEEELANEERAAQDRIADEEDRARASAQAEARAEAEVEAEHAAETRASETWEEEFELGLEEALSGDLESACTEPVKPQPPSEAQQVEQRVNEPATNAKPVDGPSTPAALRSNWPVCAGSGLVGRGIDGVGAIGSRPRSRRGRTGW